MLKPSDDIKRILSICIYLIGISFILFPTDLIAESFTIKVKNPLSINRNNEIIEIKLELLTQNFPDFDFNSFIISDIISEGNKEIQYDIILDRNSQKKIILILLDLRPNEIKELTFSKNVQDKNIQKRTQAYLGKKNNYNLKEGFYTGGYFKDTTAVKVPVDHLVHDALFQFEGPGWESERVGYRLYLDERNRVDIFGKKKPDLIIDQIGKKDLISDGKESYQTMQDWGQDIFKVGNSLGIGSVGTYNDSVVTVTKTDSIYCEVINNNLISRIKTAHYGWKFNNKNLNVFSEYSIQADNRLTKVNIFLDKEIENLCTGLAKHENTEFFISDNNEWGYIALWGKQTLVNDNLGIAVFYKKNNLIEVKEDNLSYIVILKPNNNQLTYYFCAAWEQEQDGIKDKDEFITYLNNELTRLSNPIIVEFN